MVILQKNSFTTKKLLYYKKNSFTTKKTLLLQKNAFTTKKRFYYKKRNQYEFDPPKKGL
jgi:hypothetical protein